MLFESAFSFDILLLELGDQIIFELDLLQALIVLGVGLRGFDTILLLILFKLID